MNINLELFSEMIFLNFSALNILIILALGSPTESFFFEVLGSASVWSSSLGLFLWVYPGASRRRRFAALRAAGT